MSQISRGHKALAGITTVMLYAGLAALVLMTILVVAQVVCRNAFDLGLPWADELARFCGIALVFLTMPRLLLDGKHIAMDFVPNMLPGFGRAAAAVAGKLLILCFCGILLWSLYKFLLRAAKFSTPALGIPNLIYYLPAILGFVFLAVVALYLIWRPGSSTGTPPEPGA